MTSDTEAAFLREQYEKNGPMVEVPVRSLLMLYDCARSYDTRIPEGNGRDWVLPIEDVIQKWRARG